MPARNHLIANDAVRAVGWLEASQIETTMFTEKGVSKCVKQRLKKVAEGGNTIGKDADGHEKNTTPQEDVYASLEEKKYKILTTSQIAAELVTATGNRAYARIIYRRFKMGGLYSRKPV